MLNGLDLFSGIGGIALALAPWVRPAAYCEIDRYAQSVLLSRMAGGDLPMAPIWDDVRTLRASAFDDTGIDIIYGGFPCQDISVAGNGAGLDGERSGLFWEIVRLCREFNRKIPNQRPTFIFLENVPAITSHGGLDILATLTTLGYDTRWCVIPAHPFAAISKGERWFLLAKAKSHSIQGNLLETCRARATQIQPRGISGDQRRYYAPSRANEPKPRMVRVVNGIPCRVDRIKGLGNAVVRLQLQTAFEILSGIKTER